MISPTQSAVEIRRLSADQIAAAAPNLATVLLDCMAGGASISFMADLTRERAEAFWRGVAKAARSDGRVLFVAEDAQGVLGTVQLIPIGWVPIGVIPDFALYPDGRVGDTTFFYKRI